MGEEFDPLVSWGNYSLRAYISGRAGKSDLKVCVDGTCVELRISLIEDEEV